jgi:hypothetical protein
MRDRDAKSVRLRGLIVMGFDVGIVGVRTAYGRNKKDCWAILFVVVSPGTLLPGVYRRYRPQRGILFIQTPPMLGSALHN